MRPRREAESRDGDFRGEVLLAFVNVNERRRAAAGDSGTGG